MTAPIYLTCKKTGRFVRVKDHADGMRKARELGFVDFTIGPAE